MGEEDGSVSVCIVKWAVDSAKHLLARSLCNLDN